MDFKQLRSFVTIVDYRNFSRAAEKLNIAQSTISVHLAQLEDELGVKLANRTTKTIEITEIGLIVYKYATRILELKDYIPLPTPKEKKKLRSKYDLIANIVSP